MDTTSLYFGGAPAARRWDAMGTPDHRPDLRQMILAVVLDGEGRPVCCEMWPGNTAAVSRLNPVIDRPRLRFGIDRACMVADRGFISRQTMAELQARGFLYILGTRERNEKGAREVVPADKAPFVPLRIEKRRKEILYGAKAVTSGGQRYVLCRNEEEAAKDADTREAVLSKLRSKPPPSRRSAARRQPCAARRRRGLPPTVQELG